jgi:hypothetical protein
LSGDASGKADPHLRRALDEAPPERRLRAVMVLGEDEAAGGPGMRRGAGGGAGAAPPEPADYPDRTAWREAMIEHRRGGLGGELAAVKRALAELGLEVKGGATSAAVVVEGAAEQLRAALAHPGVRLASLDREHRLTSGEDDAP